MTETIEEVAKTATPTSITGLKKQANAITNRRTLYSAGIGLLPFPLVDVAAILGVQVLMIKDIANVYGVDFTDKPVRPLITTLVGDLGAIGVMSGVKAIPIVGSYIGGFTTSITGAAATFALGKVFTQHFDQGGTLLNFDPVASRKYFQDAFEEGKLYVEDLSETNETVKEKTSWTGFFNNTKKKITGLVSSNGAEDLTDLRKRNEEMKELITKLQESVDSLKAAK